MAARRTQLMIDHPNEYTAWVSMKRSCYVVDSKAYQTVGKNGIKVCDTWMKLGFAEFLKDVGPRPEGKVMLTRRHMDKNFTPRNTVWATKAEWGELLTKYRKLLKDPNSKTVKAKRSPRKVATTKAASTRNIQVQTQSVSAELLMLHIRLPSGKMVNLVIDRALQSKMDYVEGDKKLLSAWHDPEDNSISIHIS